jgi:hypothetical protein
MMVVKDFIGHTIFASGTPHFVAALKAEEALGG